MPQQPPPSDDYPFDLGSYHRKITSLSASTQKWFDRGLVWCFAFNHEEAALCFQHAVDQDDACPMAHWGLAYAVGPNYNKQWSFFDPEDLAVAVGRAYRAARAALAGVDEATPVEQALIKAIQARYPQEEPAADCGAWNGDFATAMEAVYASFPEDLDVATVYADALMNLTPWQLWDLTTGLPSPGARTLEIKSIVEAALALPGGLQHPGLLHVYIHLMEMSPSPESALPTANHLQGLVPDAGHLHHMPSHLDVLCGEYSAAIESNRQASAADERFLTHRGSRNFYTLYRAHDYHFCVYAAMFAGRFGTAMEAVEGLERSMPAELLAVESPPMADWLEAFLGIRAHVLVRFGRWDDIIALELPADESLYAATTAIVHYAKGVAHAASGRVDEAESSRADFYLAASRVPASRTLFNNTCEDILTIASAMLDGEIAYRKGEYDLAFRYLRKAMRREDGLPYDEPWGWMQPTRHAYGALLLERGRVEEALGVYLADLGMSEEGKEEGGGLARALQHRGNVWALHGAHECARRLGKQRLVRELEGPLGRALEGADVEVRASCYCRLEVEGDGDGDGCVGC